MQDRVVAGAAMIVGTSVTIQLAAALAHDLFDQLSPAGVSALRFALGALILLAAVRPSLRGRERATWAPSPPTGCRSPPSTSPSSRPSTASRWASR